MFDGLLSAEIIKVEGEPCLVNTVRDITAQKRAEKELREFEGLMRSINESAPDNIIHVDLDGTILFINRTVPGLTVEGVVGTPIFSYVPPSYIATMRACFDRVIETGQPDQYEVEYHTKDGMALFFEARVGPVMQDDIVTALTIISSDVTERKLGDSRSRTTYR